MITGQKNARPCPTCSVDMPHSDRRGPTVDEYNCPKCEDQFAMCTICDNLHPTGVVKIWWNCYLTDAGLDHLAGQYIFKSDSDSMTITMLIEEIKKLRGLPLMFEKQPVGEDLS